MSILWRLGEELARKENIEYDHFDREKETELYLKLPELEIQKSPKVLTEKTRDFNFMAFTLEDYQIVLSNSISADRILKVLPQGDEFGRVLRLKKKYGTQH